MSDDSHFSRVRKNLQIGEDFKLAHQLQEREFDIHYSSNRETNGRLVTDFKKMSEEQQRYVSPPGDAPTSSSSTTPEEDEKLARVIQENLDREELLKMEQIRRDEQLAWNLERNFGFANNNPFVHDVAQFYERGQ